jgi:hypothetical protein
MRQNTLAYSAATVTDKVNWFDGIGTWIVPPIERVVAGGLVRSKVNETFTYFNKHFYNCILRMLVIS